MFCRLCRIAHDQTDDRPLCRGTALLLGPPCRSKRFIADNRNERHSRLHNSKSKPSSRHLPFYGQPGSYPQETRADSCASHWRAEYPCEVYGREWELRGESRWCCMSMVVLRSLLLKIAFPNRKSVETRS